MTHEELEEEKERYNKGFEEFKEKEEKEQEVQTSLKKMIFTLTVTIVLCLVAGGVKYYFDHTPTHTEEYKG